MSPHVSVLCPTRLRPEQLDASLQSLHATRHGEIEVMLVADLDDPTDYEQFPCRSLTRIDRKGYSNLHEYYNLLASQASGEWLLLWNDDAIMLTDGWDQIIASRPTDRLLAPHAHHDPLITFPIIPRAWTVACGHYSMLLHCDSWWQEIGQQLQIVEWIDVHIDHQRCDLTGQEPDTVFQEHDFQLHRLFEPGAIREAHARDLKIVRGLTTGR